MTIKRLLLTVLCVAATTATATEVRIFGIPLDTPLDVQPKRCVKPGDQAEAMCWVGKPFVAKDGSLLGMLRLSNEMARPEWATYATFDVSMTKKREIRRIKVTLHDSASKHLIARSITARFGLPNFTSLAGPEPSSAEWDHPDAHVQMLCAPERCWVEFRSVIGRQERMRELEERKARAAAKPATP